MANKNATYKITKVINMLFVLLVLVSCNKKVNESQAVDSLSDSDLGIIEFKNSGNEEAQEAFIKGVLALHNFWYPVSNEAFIEARTIDPTFGLAYWGEAMSYNKTFWQIQDSEKGLEVIAVYDSLKALNEINENDLEEKLISSLRILYDTSMSKLERDKSYMLYMKKLKDENSENDEILAFYSLSLLGVLRDNQGNENLRMEAAAVAQTILDRNPSHPGALHYKIHAMDDPLHAILALDAADKYAKVAPLSNHARHMPSHIYVQLGKWDKVRSSNISARKASEKWVKTEDLSITYLDNHSLAWLAYAYTQMGLFDSAETKLELAAVNNRDTSNKRSRHYELDMLCRLWVEQQSDLSDFKLEFESIEAQSETDQAKYFQTLSWFEIENGDYQKAEEYLKRIEDLLGEEQSFKEKICAIYYYSGMSLLNYEKDKRNSFEFMKKAISIEESLNAPTGPPDVIKPVHELYAELLLKSGDYDKAIEMFEKALNRTPNRSMSRLGLARTYRFMGNIPAAKYQYEMFAENYERASDDLNQSEALTFIKNNELIESNPELNLQKELPNYDSKLKITQCLPLI